MGKSVAIREYRDEDYQGSRSLWAQLSQHHAEIYEDPSIAGDDPGRGIDEYLVRSDRIGTWVADREGKIVGFIGLLDTVGEEGVAEIEPVIVDRRSRSGGIGTSLIAHVTEEAGKRGFRFLEIRPEVRNEAAFALYARLGFSHVGAISLFKELTPGSGRRWKSGIRIHGQHLSY